MAFWFADSFDLYAASADAIAGYWDGSDAIANLNLATGRFSGSRGVITATGSATSRFLFKSSGSNDALHHLVVAVQQSAQVGGPETRRPGRCHRLDDLRVPRRQRRVPRLRSPDPQEGRWCSCRAVVRDEKIRAGVLLEIARSQAKAGNRHDARDSFATARDTALLIHNQEDSSKVLRLIAEGEVEAGDLKGASVSFKAALAAARSIPDESHREIIRTRCRAVAEESGFYNNMSTLFVLERVWGEVGNNVRGMEAEEVEVRARRRDSEVESLVLGVGRFGQAFRWRKAMDRVDGEYIVI